MADGAMGMGDLRNRAAVGTLHRANGAATVELDPLRQAMQDRRNMQALKVMDASLAESDTATIRAENERLKAQIESQQLREAVDRRGAPDEWREYMLHQMEALTAKLDEASRAASEAQQTLLQERLGMVQSELARVQSQAPVSPFAMVSETIDQARAIVDKLTPRPETRGDGPPPTDPQLVKWQLTAELQREQRRMEFEERREAAANELALRREQAAEELALRKRRADLEDRFFSETAPKLLELGQRLVATWASRVESPSSAPATPAAVAPAAVGEAAGAYQPPATLAAPAPAPTLPPGVRSMTCQMCGTTIYYRETYGGVICAHCGAEYTSDHGGAQPGREGVAHDAAGPTTAPGGEQDRGPGGYPPGDRGGVDAGQAAEPDS